MVANHSALLVGLLSSAVCCASGPASLPPPPSAAMRPPPKPSAQGVRILVDTIPADARYVRDATADMTGVTIPPGQEEAFGRGLSNGVDDLISLARGTGANTIVLLSQGIGSAIRIRQSHQPLLLRPEEPRMTAILFDWKPSLRLTDSEKRVRFAIDAPPVGKDRIEQTITLELNTAGVSMSTWVYGNISRFVKLAVAQRLDTVSLRSSDDPVTDQVWLPGCDRPLKLSRTKPTIQTTIFRRE